MAPSTSVSDAGRPARDDLDDLFEDAGLSEAFDDVNGVPKQTQNPSSEQKAKDGSSTALGIDEEIKITKKRQPVAKLDETRLLSAAGVPKLRKISKQRLRFRGKGHEFSDMGRLLSMYQLWLDDLYPRAKFADGLAIIEKLGHSKRMQIMRKEWIEEGKPKPSIESEPETHEAVSPQQESETAPAVSSNTAPSTNPGPQDVTEMENAASMDSLSKGTDRYPETTADGQGAAPDEDELDALLAEDSTQAEETIQSLFGSDHPQQTADYGRHVADDDFAEEMDVMREFEAMGDPP